MTIAHYIDDRLDATPTGDVLSIFSAFDPEASASTYNANMWGGGAVDLIPSLTGVCWHETGLGLGQGVLLSPRHVLVTEHGTHTEFSGCYWILADGTSVVNSFIEERQGVGAAFGGDVFCFRMLFLNSAMPGTVPITPLLHPSLLGHYSLVGQPLVKSDAPNQLLVADCTEFGLEFGLQTCGMGAPTNPTRLQYYETAIGGDSGSPVFALYGTQLVYITNLISVGTNGGGNGPLALGFMDAIIDEFDDLNTTFSTTYEFPFFNPGSMMGGMLSGMGADKANAGIGLGL